MTGELLTANWQAEYEGILLGQGTRYNVATFEGFDLPDLRTSDVDRPIDHGAFVGPDLLAGRTIGLEVTVTGDTQDDALGRVETLKRAFFPADELRPFAIQLPATGQRLVFARPRRFAFPNRGSGLAIAVVLQLFCPDPRMYALAESADSVYLPTAAGGRTYNRTYNLAYGAMPSGGHLVVRNFGTTSTRPNLIVVGPATSPIVITNLTTEQSMRLAIDLAATDTLTIDTAEKTIVLTPGEVSRFSVLDTQSEWIEIAPGTNELTFSHGGATSAGRLDVIWRDAWF